MPPIDLIDPSTRCTECERPWSEHWGFNCDEPYEGRKFRPLLAGTYPPNRAHPGDDGDDAYRASEAMCAIANAARSTRQD